MKTLLLILTFSISYVWLNGASFAQEKEHISPMMVRKIGFSTFTATIVPRASLQAETEFSYFRNYGRYIYTTSAALPKISLRYGLTDRIEISAGTSFTYHTTKFRSTGEACLFCRTWYSNDYIWAGLKFNILRYNNGNGLLTLIGETKIPGTKAENVRTIFSLPGLKLVNSGRLSGKTGYILNVGTGTEQENAFFNCFNLSGTATWEAGKKAGFFLGLSHRVYTGRAATTPVSPAETAADLGFLYSPLPGFQLQAAAGIGLLSQGEKADPSAKGGLVWRPFR